MTLERHITIERELEELRLELNNAPTTGERRRIEAELEAMRAEFAKLTEEELP